MAHQVAVKYGAIELRSLYPRFAFRALLLATIIHFVIIGGLYVVISLGTEEAPRLITVRIPYDRIIPPPSIMNSHASPRVSIAGPPPVGNPVPVPNAEISPDATIAAQPEMNQPSISEDTATGNGGTIIIPEKIEEERAPEPFVAVEKLPVPIVNPGPVYPEIPRRAGIEGTVWVRIWVTKEGYAKKVEVLKTDSELFNQAAVDAAMQWVFTPAVMNNGPVAVWVSIPFKFQLREAR
jgi:protein TonB